MNNQSFFKKVPNISDISILLSHLSYNWSNKLNIINLEKQFQQEIANIQNSKDQNQHINHLKSNIQNIIKDLCAFTTSHLLSSATRFLNKPYSDDISQQIIVLHKLLDNKQEDYFDKNGTFTITLVLIVGLFTKFVNTHINHVLSDTNSYIFWYYGSYNKIIALLQEKYDDCFWVNSELTWKGYNNQKNVIVPVQAQPVNNTIIRFYIELLISMIHSKGSRNFIIITNNIPPKILLEHNLIKSQNLYHIN